MSYDRYWLEEGHFSLIGNNGWFELGGTKAQFDQRRLLALMRMTTQRLDEIKVLYGSAKDRLKDSEIIPERLVGFSEKELENEELTKEDYEFIENSGQELNAVVKEVYDKAKRTTIMADVHTDQNTKHVLEEAVDYVKVVAVTYKVPNGRILTDAGPVMSYYEFKQPMKDRLTDEKWREFLASNLPEEHGCVFNFAE